MVVAVLGAGSWGSALAILFSKVSDVVLWTSKPEQAAQMNSTRTNDQYLPAGIKLPSTIKITSDFHDVEDAELIVIATPVAALRSMLCQLSSIGCSRLPDIIWTCKGFEFDSAMLPSEIARDIMGDITNIGALLGPTFAYEVAMGMPTAITCSSNNTDFSKKWVNKLNGISNLRVYANNDLIGSEIGGAVKNVMAIAAGVCDGLHFGANARAALITRALSEITKLITAKGGAAATAYGLTGVGDLILTCTGDLSRNRNVGLKLARGDKIETIVANLGHVAEGVATTKVVYEYAKNNNLDMPITEAVYRIIYDKWAPSEVIGSLFARAPKFE